MKKPVIISILIFIILGLFYKTIGQKCYFLLSCTLIVVVTIVQLLKMTIFLRKTRYCPNCNTRLVKEKRTRSIDLKKEKVIILGKHFFAGTAIEKWHVLCCKNCGYEINSDSK